jgi:hypothetical protein
VHLFSYLQTSKNREKYLGSFDLQAHLLEP